MRLTRGLPLHVAAMLATLATAANPASAKTEVIEEDDGAHCAAVNVVTHQVAGGCHLAFASPIDVTFHAYIPAKTTIFSCELQLEGRIDENWEGYFTEAAFDPPHAGGPVPCMRVACDEPSGAMIPWPFHIREDAPGHEELETEFCIRAASAGAGGAGSTCDVHLDFADLGEHLQELGRIDGAGDPAEELCENSPTNPGYTGIHTILPVPLSIEAHLETTSVEGGGVELFHF